MQKINTNISNMLKYLNKRQDMLFCNKMLNVHFCTKSVWLKRCTGQKNTGRLERKHLSIQRPAEIFQQGTIPGKIYPGRSSRGAG